MARLEIEIKGPSGGGASSTSGSTAPATPASSQQTIANLQRVEQLLQRQARLTDIMVRGMQRFGEVGAQGITVMALRLQRIAEATEKRFGNVSVSIQHGMEAAARRAEAAWARVGIAIQRSAAAALRSAAPGLSQVGGAISGGVGALTSGRLIGGAIPSAIGSTASGLIRATASVGSGVASSVSGTLSNLAGGFSDLAKDGTTAATRVIGSIYKTLAGAGSVVAGALSSAFSVVGSVASALADAGGAIAGFVGDKLGTALKVTVGAAVGLAFAGLGQFAKAEEVTPAFERLARAAGQDVAGALDKLRDATRGTVSDLELMRQANRASALGAAESVDDFAKLAETSRALAKVTGVDAATALERLTLGIGRQSPKILDDLGLMVKLKEAYGDYADEIEKSVSSLSGAEQRQAILNLVNKEAARVTRGLSVDILTTRDRFAQLHATTANLLQSVGSALAPAFNKVADAVEGMLGSLGRFATNNAASAAKILSGAIGDVGGAFRDVQTLIEHASLEDVFKAATLVVDNLWIHMRSGAEGSLKFAELKIQEFFERAKAFALDNAQLIGFATGGVPGAAFGSALKVKAHLDAGGSVLSGDNAGVAASKARAESLSQQASQVSFAPQGENARLLSENNAALDALREAILHRAEPVPRNEPYVPGRGQVGNPTPIFPPITLTQGPPPPPRLGSLTSNAGGPPGIGAPNAAFTSNPAGLLPSDAIASITQFFAEAEAQARGFAKSTEGLSKVQKAILESQLDLQQSSRIESILHERTQRLEAAEGALNERRRRENELESRFNRLLDAENSFAKKREEGLAKIQEAYKSSTDSILQKHLEAVGQIEQQIKGRADQLAGLGGGLEPGGGLPLNVFKAIKKVRKGAEKERFNSLRDATQGQSSDDLAANGGALLKQALNQQAEKEVGAAALFKDATDTFFAESAKAEAARAEAEKTFLDTIEKEKAATAEAFEATRKALDAASDAIKTSVDDIKEQKKALDAITKALEKVASSVSR